MNLFDVYSLFDVTPVKALGCKVWDSNGQEYLDLYGGHAVISVGHSHPDYVAALKDQLDKIGFYSNSVVNPLQQELAQRLGKAQLFGGHGSSKACGAVIGNEGKQYITGLRAILGGMYSVVPAAKQRYKGIVVFTEHGIHLK